MQLGIVELVEKNVGNREKNATVGLLLGFFKPSLSLQALVKNNDIIGLIRIVKFC